MTNQIEIKEPLKAEISLHEKPASPFDAFSPDKFEPPRIDPSLHIFRKLTIRSLIESNTYKNKITTICARAGQGKSILAAQFIEYIQTDFCWLQLGMEDCDPVVFLVALFTALRKAIPVLKLSIVHQAVIYGKITDNEAARLASFLAQNIENHRHANFYIVIDDLHLLKNAHTSLKILETLIAKASQRVQFILISREPVNVGGHPGQYLFLDNDSLAWTYNDTAMLFSRVFKKSLPEEMLIRLHQESEGWVMGLILEGHTLADIPDAALRRQTKYLPVDRPNRLKSYFETEILNSLEPNQRRCLLLLSLLDTIHLELSQSLNLMDNIYNFLEDLLRRNFFFNRIDDPAPGYKLHKLFQNFLKSKALKEIPWQTRRILLARTGHWLLLRNRPEQAMQYYLQAQSYAMVEKILARIGLGLMASNRIAAIQQALDMIPEHIIRTHAWFNFFVGTIRVENTPHLSKTYLDQSLSLFIAQKDELGELMALTAIMSYHIGVDYRFKDSLKIIPRAEALYAKLADNLLDKTIAQPACIISCAHIIITGQYDKATEYINAVFKLTQEPGGDNIMAGAVTTRGLIYICQGNFDVCKKEVEQAVFLLKSPCVSRLNKFLILFIQYMILSLTGDFVSYHLHKALLDQHIKKALFDYTFFGFSMLMMEVENAMATGCFKQAMYYVRKGLVASGNGRSAHMQSLYWAYYAYLTALDGQVDRAISTAEKAADLRRKAGGLYFENRVNIWLAGAYTLIGHYQKAEALLQKVVSISKTSNLMNHLAGAYAHRGFLRLAAGKNEAALKDIRALMKIMKRERRTNFFAWTPHIMLTVLKTSVKYRIEPEYAQKLAELRMQVKITPTGEQIPLIEIESLGNLHIKIDGKVKISCDDFTPIQKELIALLICTPPNSILHEFLQEHFWPENPPGKSRYKLDNLLARLRKTLDRRLAPYSARNYLAVEKGIVRLQNCLIDTDRFMDEVLKGRQHFDKQEFWQATTAFLRAHCLYKGPFAKGFRSTDPVDYFRKVLQSSYLDNALGLVQILSAVCYVPQAIKVCRQALECNAVHEPLVKALYNLQVQNNNAEQAEQVVADYQKALSRRGFSEREIEEIVDHFW